MNAASANPLRQDDEIVRISFYVLIPPDRPRRHDRTATAFLVFVDNLNNTNLYPWLDNSNSRLFADGLEAYVFGNYGANHNRDVVMQQIANIFGVQGHWDECVLFVNTHWDLFTWKTLVSLTFQQKQQLSLSSFFQLISSICDISKNGSNLFFTTVSHFIV